MNGARNGRLARAGRLVAAWFDAGALAPETDAGDARIDWPRVLPFCALHVACFAAFFTGTSATALAVAAALFALRMFAITGFYHRYFSHRAFETSRTAQLLFGVLGASAVQRGPLWWAAHHRDHHRFSDTERDVHSPARHGFLWSHTGWFLARSNFRTRIENVPDLARFPELRFLDRFDALVPALLAGALYGLGAALAAFWPALGTDGPMLLVWGFCISTVALYHATFSINSVAHGFGRRAYATRDTSRNSLLLALLTFGEGWHNNHHHYPASARQGFRRGEIDLTYLLLKLLAKCGVVWDLKPVPPQIVAGAERGDRERAA